MQSMHSVLMVMLIDNMLSCLCELNSAVFFYMYTGSCITSVMPEEMCGLTAVATECAEVSLTGTTCECQEGYFYQYEDSVCQGLYLCIPS